MGFQRVDPTVPVSEAVRLWGKAGGPLLTLLLAVVFLAVARRRPSFGWSTAAFTQASLRLLPLTFDLLRAIRGAHPFSDEGDLALAVSTQPLGPHGAGARRLAPLRRSLLPCGPDVPRRPHEAVVGRARRVSGEPGRRNRCGRRGRAPRGPRQLNLLRPPPPHRPALPRSRSRAPRPASSSRCGSSGRSGSSASWPGGVDSGRARRTRPCAPLRGSQRRPGRADRARGRQADTGGRRAALSGLGPNCVLRQAPKMRLSGHR